MNDFVRYFKVIEISRDEFTATTYDDIGDGEETVMIPHDNDMYIAIDTSSACEFTIDVNEIGQIKNISNYGLTKQHWCDIIYI